ncbi:hypothetical protein GQR58_021959 [Nymphon striatum]|nr:hypothetical protein GQR58_021959 [Nymphon striatum]
MLKEITSTSLSDTGQNQHDVNLNDLAVGELVTYSISMKFPEGTTEGVTLTDTMPSGTDGIIEIVGLPTITSAGNGIVTSNSTVTVNPANDGFTIDFGSVLNEPDNVDNASDFITATFSYTDGNNAVQQLSDTVAVDIVEPEMSITKAMTVSNGIATISVNLTNTGTASAYDIEITDILDSVNWDTSNITPLTIPSGFTMSTVSGPGATETTVLMQSDSSSTSPANSIEINETVSFQFTVPVQPSIASINNTATNTSATSVPGGSTNERDEPDVAASATLNIPLIELEKTAGALSDTNGDGEVGGVGDNITYTFNVINTGGVDLTNITVTDANPAVVMSGNPISLVVGDSDNSITGIYEITQTDMNLGSITNTATVTADGPNGSTSDVSDDPTDSDNTDVNGDGEPDGPTVVTLPRNPLFNMEKTASPASLAAPGKITYTFTFTNTGNIALSNLAVNDTDIDAGTLTCNGDSEPDGDIDSLAIDAVQTCTAERTITQDQINLGLAITNNASASATDLRWCISSSRRPSPR